MELLSTGRVLGFYRVVIEVARRRCLSAARGDMNSKALCARLTLCGKLRSRKAHLPNWVNIGGEQSAQFIDNLVPLLIPNLYCK